MDNTSTQVIEYRKWQSTWILTTLEHHRRYCADEYGLGNAFIPMATDITCYFTTTSGMATQWRM